LELKDQNLFKVKLKQKTKVIAIKLDHKTDKVFVLYKRKKIPYSNPKDANPTIR